MPIMLLETCNAPNLYCKPRMMIGFVRCSCLATTSTINMFTAMGGRVAGGVMLQKWVDLYCCMEIWSGKE